MTRRKRKTEAVANRDRSEYRGASRKAAGNIRQRGGSHGDKRKARSKRAARDRRLWD